METTEKTFESYCRYIKNCFTVSNIQCKSHEIDIVAVNITGKQLHRYHIEVSISISETFAELTHKDPPPHNKAKKKRTIEYFIEKFNKPEVIKKLDSIGFKPNSYKKIIVTNG
jgi:hypothetical protein